MALENALGSVVMDIIGREQPHCLVPIRFLGEHDLELREVHLRLMPRRRLETVFKSARRARTNGGDVVRHRRATAPRRLRVV